MLGLLLGMLGWCYFWCLGQHLPAGLLFMRLSCLQATVTLANMEAKPEGAEFEFDPVAWEAQNYDAVEKKFQEVRSLLPSAMCSSRHLE